MLTLNLAGRLGRDAELRSTPSGKSVANFSVAVDVRRGQEKTTQWIDCAIWEKRAEALAPYLKKGTAVAVSGDLSVRQYDKRDGGHGVAVECAVRELTLLGGGDKAAATNGSERSVESYPGTPARAPAAAQTGDFDDSIPF